MSLGVLGDWGEWIAANNAAASGETGIGAVIRHEMGQGFDVKPEDELYLAPEERVRIC